MIRPSLDCCIDVLRSLGSDVTSEDLLATAEYVNSDHQSTDDEFSRDRGWGLCERCGTRWPCEAWVDVEYAITEWLIKSSTEVIRRRREV